MGISVFPAAGGSSLSMKRTTLNSGTSYTVPAGVNFINVTTVGGGGGGGVQTGSGNSNIQGIHTFGKGGQIMHSTVNTTPGATINYSIGSGGSGGTRNDSAGFANAGAGGTTTFTGATSASGGAGGGTSQNNAGSSGISSNQGITATNGGIGAQGIITGNQTNNAGPNGGSGGSGYIIIEYWS